MSAASPIRIGAVGCGNIADTYFNNLRLFPDAELVACSDLDAALAERKATEFDLDALPFDAMLRRDDIDLILNITNPAAHAEVSLAAIEARKHVYSEKPLATSLADGRAILHAAQARGVRVGTAPDTFLGPGIQTARQLIDAGQVGDIASGTAAFLSHGMEHWHPNPGFFYQPGGGPVLDMGPYYLAALVALLGPVERVVAQGRSGSAERRVTAEGPMQGRTVRVETLTNVHALLSFANGADIVFLSSWDVWRHSLPALELHGRHASLRLPDPELFGGRLELGRGREPIVPLDTGGEVFGKPYGRPTEPHAADYRGLGVADMAQAIRCGRPHRCTAELGLHLLAVMLSMLDSAHEDGRSIAIPVSCTRPSALGPDEARALRG